tara:strand:+ start:2999 stop:4189 length:1191 start_codon:yes stop_codon:yes gene_type:complete
MGWLDKGFKNIIKGGKDLLSGPAGIMLLSAAAPWLSASLGAGATGSMLGKLGASKYGALLKSPWVKNALTNAAMQGGIATLTGSKHPWKAMGYAALGSMPFTALQSAQGANAFNIKNGLEGTEDAAKWYDMALGNDITIPRSFKGLPHTDLDLGVGPTQTITSPQTSTELLQSVPASTQELAMYQPGSHHFGAQVTPEKVLKSTNIPGIDMSYFTNPGASKVAGKNPGLAGLASALTGDLDLMATAVPQIAGMYGGRMTEEEQWLASKEKQIRLWGFQHGIPYEEAKEIWKDGYRNPYYQTRTPHDYGDFQWSGSDAYAGKNKGGSIQYKDDYTAGGSAVGPGTGTSDDIQPVALSNGEFVFTEEATNNFPGGPEGLYSLMNSLDPNSERPEEARV